jgi:hypothetical protein
MSQCLPIKMVLHKYSVPAQIFDSPEANSLTNLSISAQNIRPTIYDNKAETIQATPNRESHETNPHQFALSLPTYD